MIIIFNCSAELIAGVAVSYVRSLGLLVLLACAGDDTTDKSDTAPPEETGTTGGLDTIDTGFMGPWVVTEDNGDGTFTTEIWAISTVEAVYFSFLNGEVSVGTEPPTEEWDLAFKREIITTNGGVSGDGTVEVAELLSIGFESVRWAPVGGFAVDQPDADDDGEIENAFKRWFIYNYDNHTLTPDDITYVVRTPNGDVRLELLTYYSSIDGNSGHPTFTWGWLTEPGPVALEGDALRIDASDPKEWVHVSLREQIALAPPDPGTSDDWELALRGPQVALNGGVSGPGGLAAAAVPSDYVDVTDAPPANQFASDAPDADADGVPEYAMASAFEETTPGAWAPAALTWVLAHPDKSYDKLRFEAYDDGTGAPGHPLVRSGPLSQATTP